MNHDKNELSLNDVYSEYRRQERKYHTDINGKTLRDRHSQLLQDARIQINLPPFFYDGVLRYLRAWGVGETLEEVVSDGIEKFKRSLDNFEAFIRSNPDAQMRVKPEADEQMDALCGHPNHPGHLKKCQLIDDSYIWENDAGNFLIAEPYNLRQVGLGDAKITSTIRMADFSFDSSGNLVAEIMPKQYSWCHPYNTYLIFLGQQKVIDSLDINYIYRW